MEDKALQAITDGKFYTANDMVRMGSHDCSGCSSCCKNMGESILLDPFDVYQLTTNMGLSFEELLQGPVELHAEQGLILPNLKMIENSSTGEGACGFLSPEGRCSIHAFRPGICRLFPLGRNYSPEKLEYFFLKDACPAPNKTKVKIDKWIGISDLKSYEEYLVKWHNLTKQIRQEVLEEIADGGDGKALSMLFLQVFYFTPFEGETENAFYEEFERRLSKLR